MKKALVLMLAVLLVGTIGMAKTDYFDNIVVEGVTDIQTMSAGVWQGTVIAHEYGGLEADVSGYDGLVRITGGNTVVQTASSDILAFIGSATDAAARTELGVEIGADVQAWDSELDDIAALVQSDSYVIIGDDSNWVQETGDTLRTSLGLAIDTNVQAWDAQLDDIADLVQSDSYIIVGDDTNWVQETGATARTSLGLGTGDSPTFTGLTLSADAAINGGDITSTATQIGITTNDDLYRYSVTGLAWDTSFHTQSQSYGLQVQNGQPLACATIDGGVAEVGSTEGYVSVGDDEDVLRFIMPIPALWVDNAQTTSISISFDIDETGAADPCNIDVLIYEYGTNLSAIVTDTLTIANAAARAWVDLDTLSTGFGAVATLSGDDSYLIIEITATADADDFNIYGARLKYRVGLQATQ